MSLSEQEIYEEALRRAGIPVSSTPLTFSGFPPNYNHFRRAIEATPTRSITSMYGVSSHQIQRFELELHNLYVEKQNKEIQEQNRVKHERILNDKYQNVLSNHEEREKFQQYLLMEEQRKKNEEDERIRKEQEELRKKEEEQQSAIQHFKEQLEERMNKDYYSQSDECIIELGNRLRVGLIQESYPHWIYDTWRQSRYQKLGILPMNFSFFDDANAAARNSNRSVADGYPIQDKADEEVAILLRKELEKWYNFCKRMSERYESKSLVVANIAAKRIEELEENIKNLQSRNELLEEKLSSIRNLTNN